MKRQHLLRCMSPLLHKADIPVATLNVRYWGKADMVAASLWRIAHRALAALIGFFPNIFRLTGRAFKSALAQVRSSLNHADEPHRFTARRAARAVGYKHH
jgi:hypothetical protein